MLAFAPLVGRFVSARGPKPAMIAGFGVMALGGLGLTLFNSSVYELALFAIPALVGNVMVLIAMSNIIVLSVSPKELGIQTGMNQTFRNLGSAVGPVIAATVTASYMTTVLARVPGVPVPVAVPTYSILGFQLVFAITAGVAVAGLLLSLAVRNFRFHADGTRYGQEVVAPAEGVSRPEEPAVSVDVRRVA
jgi:MFS family permease